jgi:hypothetical protein
VSRVVSSAAYRDAQDALRDRGVHLSQKRLQRHITTTLDLANLTDWALMGEPFARAPQWLRDLVARGGKDAHLISGVCRDCGCTDEYGCAGGCAWVDNAQTLCSAHAGNEKDSRGRT